MSLFMPADQLPCDALVPWLPILAASEYSAKVKITSVMHFDIYGIILDFLHTLMI